MNKEQLLEQVRTLHLNTNKAIIKQLIAQWDDFEKKLVHLQSIRIAGVKPMTRIDATPITYLRPDTPGATYKQHYFLQNAPATQDDYIVIKRVVGNDKAQG